MQKQTLVHCSFLIWLEPVYSGPCKSVTWQPGKCNGLLPKDLGLPSTLVACLTERIPDDSPALSFNAWKTPRIQEGDCSWCTWQLACGVLCCARGEHRTMLGTQRACVFHVPQYVMQVHLVSCGAKKTSSKLPNASYPRHYGVTKVETKIKYLNMKVGNLFSARSECYIIQQKHHRVCTDVVGRHCVRGKKKTVQKVEEKKKKKKN